MAGMRVDIGPVARQRGGHGNPKAVVMGEATVKSVPEMAASVLGVPEEGEKVTLKGSSALSEALYVRA